ncbi:NlpC/P60 family protein [Escherichia coli]
MTRRGVDCSGFVVVTMRDRFDLQLPVKPNNKPLLARKLVKKTSCCRWRLVFFKTGSGQNALHVGT